MDKKDVVYIPNRILLSQKNNISYPYYAGGTGKRIIVQGWPLAKPNAKTDMSHGHLREIHSKQRDQEVERPPREYTWHVHVQGAAGRSVWLA
jgi:hypothetical protein